MTSVALRPLSVGEIIDASFQVYRRHFAALATIVLVCSGLPMLLQIYMRAVGGVHWGFSILYLLLSVVLGLIATGATVFVVSESYLGRGITAREALARATPFVVPMILASLGVGLLAFVGFILFVIPGIIAICGLAITVPALVVESLTPGAAMGRSWSLTRDHRLRMLGLFCVIFILLVVPYIAVMGVFGVIAALISSSGSGAGAALLLVGVVIAAILQLLLSPLYQAALVIAYYDLRVRKEGFDLEVLANSVRAA
ncbi:MAG TPA: hypothetical protein VK688_01635 [Gemmatimonadales bacterium]|nr:hypothetical protein [Gemmatimonadales bacterium]